MTGPSYRQLNLKPVSLSWQPLLPTSEFSPLYLSDSSPDAHATLSRYRDYLGHQIQHVIIDCRTQLHVDAIAALCGTVTAGGSLTLLINNAASESPMLQRLIKHWQPVSVAHYSPAPSFPTDEQQQALNQLTRTDQVHLLIADRGRGKSHLLGKALATYLQSPQPKKVIVTAPRKANARVLLNQAGQVQFVAWDKLLQQQLGDALLVIDEAAGIPLWAIQRLCQHFQPWMLATTTQGYEGCGRGFTVHFKQWVTQQFTSVAIHHLSQPVRWPAYDPLERWLNSALLLTPSPAELNNKLPDGVYRAAELPEDHLHQAFELLLQAHYQSSPNDLALLLDDDQQRLVLHYQGNKIVAVAWLALEGDIDEQLQEPIVSGKRRPKGNLAPQALAYFLQQRWALQQRWCRVVRIAVREPQRRQGLGSQLLRFVRDWAITQNQDFLATSFGYAPYLLQFWQQNHFYPARISTAVDRVSARHPLIMAYPLNKDAATKLQPLKSYGEAELKWLIDGTIMPLPKHPVVKDIIDAFKNGIVKLESARFALIQQPQIPDDIRELLIANPLPIGALKNLAGVEQRQQIDQILKSYLP
ncbi:GNAT family N-acetyltransferase [Idiomarina seosinensis]|uniref:GNAT family N-acetyltransferase n=1 Tax=Idiomarina seosinensis TaxID=281739 RepID=UPI00384ED91A